MPENRQRHVPASPTGEQWAIGHGGQRLTVTEVGATIRCYTVDGRDVLDGFGPDEWSESGRGQVLAPWPNRLGDGRYEFSGRRAQAALDEPELHNAIHGLVRWACWRLEAQAQNMLSAVCTVHPSPGYPFTLGLRIEYRLGRDGLTVSTRAENLGSLTLPFGLGFHPYLRPGEGSVDTARLRLPATRRLVLDDRGLPTGELRPVSGTELDFTAGRAIGATRMDTAFTGLHRDADGLAWASLDDAEGDGGTELWVDDRFNYLMCYTGDTIADPARRRRAVAIEPMTCPPDALRSGKDLVVLGAGRGVGGELGVAAPVTPASPGAPPPADGGSLGGHVALVTGSSSGIGEEVARAFARAGASVLVNSATSVEAGRAVAESLPDALYVQGDITAVGQCEALVAAALGRWGRLDTLVNNAGATEVIAHHDLAAADLAVWRRIFEVNVFGTWAMTCAAVPALRQSRGSVVNVTSIAGLRPTGSSIPYASSKAALNHQTVLLAKALGPEVRVNAVAPGLIDTPWTADWDLVRQAVTEVAPLKRSGRPGDVAPVVVALATGAYVTGQIVAVDGGLTLAL